MADGIGKRRIESLWFIVNEGRHSGEKGAALLELVASMPLLAVLSVALGTAFVFGVRAYLFLMSDWALQEQVGYAMERMVMDLRYAEDAKIEGNRLKVHCREVSGHLDWFVYERTNETAPRIRRSGQPLTGQSTLGKIKMKEFEARFADAREQAVFLRLVGENTLTGQTYELETMVTLMGKTP